MLPEDIREWIYTQLVALQYADASRTLADSVNALETFPKLRPFTEFVNSGELLLVLRSTEPPNVVVIVPRAYPMQPPSLFVDGQPKIFEAPTSIIEALRAKPPVPAKPPSKEATPSEPLGAGYPVSRSPMSLRSENSINSHQASPSRASPLPKSPPPVPNRPPVPAKPSRPPIPGKPGRPQLPPKSAAIPQRYQHTLPLPVQHQVGPGQAAYPFAPAMSSQLQASQLPGQLPGQAGQPGQLPGQLSGQAGQLPGQLSGQAGQLPGQLPVQAPGHTPAISGQVAGQAIGQAPAFPAQAPVQPTAPIDLMNSTSISAPVQTERSQLLEVLQTELHKLPAPKEFAEIDDDANKIALMEAQVKTRRAALEARKQQLNSNIQLLAAATSDSNKISELADSQFVPPQLSDLVHVVDEQAAKARAADRATRETLTLLPKALDSGSMPLHVYLPLVRQFAREQFYQKVRSKDELRSH